VTGGRKTASALYRIRYVGGEPTEPARASPPTRAAILRRELEDLQTAPRDRAAGVVAAAWPHLSSEDRWIRFAARVALEHQDPGAWQANIARESNAWAILESVMALARTNRQSAQPLALEALARLDWEQLDEPQRLHLIRDYALLLLRAERPAAAVAAAVVDRLNDRFPSGSPLVDRELSRMLAASDAPDLVPRAMRSLETAHTQEAQIHYAAMLRVCRQGWTTDLRRAYFDWFVRSAALAGGHSFGGYLQAIREEAIAALPENERQALAEVLAKPIERIDPSVDLKSRPVIQDWNLADLSKSVESELTQRDFDNGKKMFTVAQCFKCHRMEGQGGYVGPDLAGIGRRYSRQELLESLLEPSRVISDQYLATRFLLADGRTVTGRVVNLSGDDFLVQTDMLNPGKLTAVNVDQIDERSPSKVSPMPDGLLDTLNKDDILDLLAYLRSGGDRAFEELRPEPPSK
jgi:hypothetical protein